MEVGVKSMHVWPVLQEYLRRGSKLETSSSHLQIIDILPTIVGSNFQAKISDGVVFISAIISPRNVTMGSSPKKFDVIKVYRTTGHAASGDLAIVSN